MTNNRVPTFMGEGPVTYPETVALATLLADDGFRQCMSADARGHVPFRLADLPVLLPAVAHCAGRSWYGEHWRMRRRGLCTRGRISACARHVAPGTAQRARVVLEASCARVGWSYRRLEPPPAVVAANLRWLAGYRHPRNQGPPRLRAALAEAFAEARPLQQRDA
ncbi:hypothetical protein [Streptomyces sp. NPDC008121]|uniref:hypothetical protein n=1 Tax=Streptomyces sp. NPDC008121 TaxID=3364809 RepID=UPI0036EBD8A4